MKRKRSSPSNKKLSYLTPFSKVDPMILEVKVEAHVLHPIGIIEPQEAFLDKPGADLDTA